MNALLPCPESGIDIVVGEWWHAECLYVYRKRVSVRVWGMDCELRGIDIEQGVACPFVNHGRFGRFTAGGYLLDNQACAWKIGVDGYVLSRCHAGM